MQTLTLSLTDEQAERLREQAKSLHVSVEEVILRHLETMLEISPPFNEDDTIDADIEYVISKNRELLQRLA